ncbi:MAG: adenylate/guanylate cyclase domain-containing protein [Chloroflexota bacterium]|nr:adenylate/guanylate cyclase domain-containing protein [Chloroflexota bacterium]
MEPEVHYCTTDDGVRLAYTITGEGPVHVLMQDAGASHTQLEWAHPTIGPVLASLSKHTTLVRFDPRGVGLSDRVLPSTAPEWLRDLGSVVTRLALKDFALTAVHSSCRPAIAYAAGHPGQVSRLVLIDGFARGRDVLERPAVRAIYAAGANDYEMAIEAISALVFGPGRIESAANGAYLRACIDRKWADPRLNRSLTKLDVSGLMDQVAVPTLVLHHKASRVYTAEMSRDLAAGIPDARLIEVDGLWGDDIDGFAARIVAFVNDSERISAASGVDSQSSVRTILFTDIVGHTEMMQRLGDAKGRDVLREHERITRETLKAHGGAEVKTMGDGFMASFGSVTSAMECAISLQRAFAVFKLPSPLVGEGLGVRAGLNAGEPIEEDGDLFGATVILASRIAAKAGAGEILVPDTVRGLLSGKGFMFGDRGDFVPKGFDDAVRLWDVRWRSDDP